MKNKTYAEKLLDPRWDKKRKQILKRDGHKCKLCKDVDSKLHVHHLFYDNKYENPWDYPDDFMVTLCERCHKKQHEITTEYEMMQDILKSLLIYFNIPLLKLWQRFTTTKYYNISNGDSYHRSLKYSLIELIIEHENKERYF